MYLSNIKLWNYRKFGTSDGIDLDKPNLDLDFSKGINVKCIIEKCSLFNFRIYDS